MKATEKATAGTMAQSNTEQQLSYDKFVESSSGQIRQYCDIVFEPDDIVELRFIKQGSPPKKEWCLAKTFPDRIEGLRELNQQGYNIYIGVNPRVGKGVSGDKNIEIARTLFVDFDHLDDDPLEEVRARISAADLPEPTMTINSGHGIHCYWRLIHPITDMAMWREHMAALISALYSDPQIKNPERIMRLPGFNNTKNQPFVPCRIEEISNQRYGINTTGSSLDTSGCLNLPTRSFNDYQKYYEGSGTSSNSSTSGTSGTSGTSDTSSTSSSHFESESIEIERIDPVTKGIFFGNLPSRFGTRRACMLRIARELKSTAVYAEKSPGDFREIFEIWHRDAIANMREQCLEENWLQFCFSFNNAYSFEELPVARTFKKAIEQPPPPELERKYPMSPELHRLALFCRQLQRDNIEDTFFLAQETAAQLLGILQEQVSRLMKILIKEGYIELVHRGRSKGNARASIYKYVGNDL